MIQFDQLINIKIHHQTAKCYYLDIIYEIFGVNNILFIYLRNIINFWNSYKQIIIAYSLLNNIKSIDLFTKPVQLMIKKDEGHKTFYGAILTLALLFVMMANSILWWFAQMNQQDNKNYHRHLYQQDWDSINELKLQGQFLAAEYKYLAIDIYMCTDATRKANGPECKSKEEIDQILNHNYLSIQLTTIVTDFTNAKSPYSISSRIFKEINFFMQPITTIVDQGLALQDLQEYKALSFEKYSEIIDFTDSEQLVHISMRLDQSAKINQKTYQKLQDVLAQIGGLWNVLFTLTLILITPFSKFQYRLTMINSLFNFEGSEVDINSKSLYEQQNQTIIERFS
ncbi:hypothetical protein pb186bvf_013028 [Paramecium bursaria]